MTIGAYNALGEAQRLIAHLLALGICQHVHDVLACAPKLAVITVVNTVRLGLDEYLGLFVGEQQPVTVFLAQGVPRRIDVYP